MSIETKLFDPTQPVLLYGTTPPRASASAEDIENAASKLIDRVQALPLDGLVVYDVQDESARTEEPRPFPFLPTIDTRRYSQLLHERTGLPAVNYKYVGQMDAASWQAWLDQSAGQYGIRYLSLVGLPTSRNITRPPEALLLTGATQMAAAHPSGFTLGGVAIAERHQPPRSESVRMIEKAAAGCQFFISQAVYSPAATIKMLEDYTRDCHERGVVPRRIILTFTPCGNPRTMQFMKWLGIAIPPSTEQAILEAASPLAKSIELCCANLKEILGQNYAKT
ncbi:MAG: hypothetical protein JOZ57_03930, partial [Abitibacteriaceae bacterium]|nr:hypothetical protein [Abditibacteriaceae bacterium]